MKLQIIKHPRLQKKLNSFVLKTNVRRDEKLKLRIRKLQGKKLLYLNFIPRFVILFIHFIKIFLLIISLIPIHFFALLLDFMIGILLAVVNTPAWFIKSFLTPEGQLALRESAKKATAEAEERRKARIERKRERLIFEQQERDRVIKAARLEKLKVRNEFRRILSEASTDDLLALYAESKEDSTPAEVVTEIKTVLNARNITTALIQTAITNYKLEKIYIQNLQMQAQQNASLEAELRLLQEQQNKRRLQLGIGIGFWL